MDAHITLSTDNFDVGSRSLVETNGLNIGVFNVNDDYYAYVNDCPNMGGPVCEGQIGGTMVTTIDSDTGQETTQWEKEGLILSCPWCSWEFDLTTGKCESFESAELKPCDVQVEDGDITIRL